MVVVQQDMSLLCQYHAYLVIKPAKPATQSFPVVALHAKIICFYKIVNVDTFALQVYIQIKQQIDVSLVTQNANIVKIQLIAVQDVKLDMFSTTKHAQHNAQLDKVLTSIVYVYNLQQQLLKDFHYLNACYC